MPVEMGLEEERRLGRVEKPKKQMHAKPSVDATIR